MPKIKKPSIKSLAVTHGKLEDEKPNRPSKASKYRSLDQIFGDTGLSKYNTLEEDVYLKQLKEMNLTDLQAHASKIGLLPIDNFERLTKNLLNEFRIHASKYKTPTESSVKSQKPINSSVMKILSEGR